MEYEGKQLRHEHKYIISLLEYHALRQRLAGILARDENSGPNNDYSVRSLYFDDMYNSALVEKEAGVGSRKKFRIRVYNLSKTQIRLERKSKRDLYTIKEVAPLTISEYYSVLAQDYAFLRDTQHPVLKDFYYQTQYKWLRPAVIVDYEREAYVSQAGNVRITFDKNLRAALNGFDVFDSTLAAKAVFTEPQLILEVKYDDFIPGYVRNLLQISSHNKLAVSKYVLCRLIKYNVKY